VQKTDASLSEENKTGGHVVNDDELHLPHPLLQFSTPTPSTFPGKSQLNASKSPWLTMKSIWDLIFCDNAVILQKKYVFLSFLSAP